jgi:proteasome activator subunit 4
LTIPDLEPFLVNHIGVTLHSLLKKTDLITGEQLMLDWRPLYELVERFLFSKYETLGLMKIPQSLPGTLKNVVKGCR